VSSLFAISAIARKWPPISRRSLSGKPRIGASNFDQIAAGTASAPLINLTVQLDAATTKQFHEDNTLQVVVNNPRAVQHSALSAMRSSFGRADASIMTQAPLAIRS
jgi:hypothetical protein